MGEGNNLINLGDLSKPATALIEKISDGIGGIFKPSQIKRIAKAEAAAEIIKASAVVEISEIEQRSIVRLIQEEGRKQENIESITVQAINKLNDEAKPKEMDDDWISHFFEKCRNVSNKDMQGLWSGVLAGEASSPGTYSKRTLEIISTLDKEEAQLFTALCGFAIYKTEAFVLVLDKANEIYEKAGLDFDALNHLETIGLIKLDTISGFSLTDLEKEVGFYYYGSPLIFEHYKESDNQLNVGSVMLTKAGKQLALICGSRENPEFISYVIEHYKKQGIIVTVPLPNMASNPTP